MPLRGLEDAKTRLGAELDPEERLELVIAMSTRTLTATRDAPGIRGTVLVTADPAAAELAEGLGATTIVQRLPGLNAALREARGVALEHGATAVLVLPIDLPAISADAIEALLRAGAAHLAAGSAARARRPGSPRDGDECAPRRAADARSSRPSARAASRPTGRPPAVAGAVFVRHGGPLTLDVDTGADLLAAEAGSTGGRGAA